MKYPRTFIVALYVLLFAGPVAFEQWWKWRNEWVEVTKPYTVKAGASVYIMLNQENEIGAGWKITAVEEIRGGMMVMRRKDLAAGQAFRIYDEQFKDITP